MHSKVDLNSSYLMFRHAALPVLYCAGHQWLLDRL